MIDGIPHVRMNPPLRGRAELIRHISHSGKAPVPAIMYYQHSEDKATNHCVFAFGGISPEALSLFRDM